MVGLEVRRVLQLLLVWSVAVTVWLSTGRALADIPACRTNFANVGESIETGNLEVVPRTASISRELFQASSSSPDKSTRLAGFARDASWEAASIDEIDDALDLIPDSPDILLAPAGDGAVAAAGSIVGLQPLVTTGLLDPDSPLGESTPLGIRPVGGSSLPGVDGNMVVHFTGATSNRLETAPLPGAVFLAALGFGLVGIARIRGKGC
jgi:hypothetical protein